MKCVSKMEDFRFSDKEEQIINFSLINLKEPIPKNKCQLQTKLHQIENKPTSSHLKVLLLKSFKESLEQEVSKQKQDKASLTITKQSQLKLH